MCVAVCQSVLASEATRLESWRSFKAYPFDPGAGRVLVLVWHEMRSMSARSHDRSVGQEPFEFADGRDGSYLALVTALVIQVVNIRDAS